MVRQATATAVSASISTPVGPVTLTLARTLKPGSLRSGSMSTAMFETGRGWQSGTNSCVRFAAMMPAMRAAPSTSPFFALPARTRSRVFAPITTRPSAMAFRSLGVFADTSTMRASPPRPRWLSLDARAIASLRGADPALFANERTRRGLDVVFAHEAFADEQSRNADRSQVLEIGGRKDSALAHDNAAGRDPRRQALAGGERRLEGLEVAIVDADQPRAQAQCPFELMFVVDLQQDVHAERLRGVLEILCRAVIDRRHDDQDAISPPRPRLSYLIDVVHEILAQDRKLGRGASGDEVFGLALERGRIGEHREAGRTPPLIGACQCGCIEICADQAFRGTRLLDLGDQGIVAGRERVGDGSDKSAWGRGRSGGGLDRDEGTGALGSRDLLALIALDAGENVGHAGYSPLGLAWSAGRRIASPSRIRNRNEALEPACGFAGIDRRLCECQRLLEILGASRDHQRRGRVENGDVAESPALALEHVDERLRVLPCLAAAEGFGLDPLQSHLLRRDLESTHCAVLERRHMGWPRRRDLVETVRAVHHPDRLGAEIFQHVGERLDPLAREYADHLPLDAGGIGERA